MKIQKWIQALNFKNNLEKRRHWIYNRLQSIAFVVQTRVKKIVFLKTTLNMFEKFFLIFINFEICSVFWVLRIRTTYALHFNKVRRLSIGGDMVMLSFGSLRKKYFPLNKKNYFSSNSGAVHRKLNFTCKRHGRQSFSVRYARSNQVKTRSNHSFPRRSLFVFVFIQLQRWYRVKGYII